MSRFLTSEEIKQLSPTKLIEYQDFVNRKLVDDAPDGLRSKLGAILFRVEIECSFILDPAARALMVNEKMMAGLLGLRDEMLSDMTGDLDDDPEKEN